MPQGDHVPGGVVRVIELVGSSPNSFSDAVRNAVRLASQSLPNIRGVEVLSSNADVDDAGNLTPTRSSARSPSWWRPLKWARPPVGTSPPPPRRRAIRPSARRAGQGAAAGWPRSRP